MKTFDPYQHIGFLSHLIARLTTKYFTPKLIASGYDFPASCIGILAELWMEDGRTQKDLGHALIKSKSSINKMLKALEEENMIVKKDDPGDRRNKLIFLTPKGHQFKDRFEYDEKEMNQILGQRISESEISQSAFILKKMYLNLSQEIYKNGEND